MAVIGKNILDNLTTGMYSDSKVSYREYIQNACDQIDLAISQGLINSDDALIDIYIDQYKRYISIRDNATGVAQEVFAEVLGDIANSNKQLGSNKGFRLSLIHIYKAQTQAVYSFVPTLLWEVFFKCYMDYKKRYNIFINNKALNI